ncbi:predicted protein [Histoplasma mississippiense (nom. inval.)]|uniref:predicted protein n=1 Tax=Ajellomyces capsulatus (strain NAm1 / WU24) TaxID=2059318 RepID=UPI000157D1A7|nr:predicted protein [Histoplasma mississippiense (nom. inval.)]EDN11318.1 predicted protein [Histoplasma mississippiense (nom. inval.)]
MGDGQGAIAYKGKDRGSIEKVGVEALCREGRSGSSGKQQGVERKPEVDKGRLTSRKKHGQRPCFRSLPKGMETCYAGEISMYTERENRIQVATLEKTQLIAKDFSELRIHFWPDERALKKVVTGKEQRMTERAKKRRKKKHLSR